MEHEKVPTLTDAHQQIRLGDIQAAAQKWTVAIEYYARAIEYFKALQKDLKDKLLEAIVQAQIVDCEKTIHYYRLKHHTDLALKAEHKSKVARTQSVSRLNTTDLPRNKLTRRNTINLQNTNASNVSEGYDSLVETIFNRKKTEDAKAKSSTPVMIKKTKDDLQKMEELKISNDAFKHQLIAAFDYIQKLENENRELQLQKENRLSDSKTHFDISSTPEEDDEQQLEDTL